MICDEIQCGMGRTGTMFAYQQYGICPDIVTMAKGIGNGIPVGAFATTAEIAGALVPGDHGTTFGGNPLACVAVSETLNIFKERNLTAHVQEMGKYLKEQLERLVQEKAQVTECRGMGLMCGLELSEPVTPYIQKALERGVIFMSAGTDVIRFVPPLVVEQEHIDEMIAVLEEIL